ncbi:serine/threonine-protein phosphatase [Streptomyces sp. RS10V-4]|uniref:PP2C family protein-serine/threonine phosphatase n=1 Tax=Streptomyces rhizoryzae TaxID=2932493 RepID=UPI002004DDD4|nr:PP2C family protein-serine/threonine phosphatase [Streptomyces rhizoryzae]MCK7622376.1 serine/threonine-protein phosphatase [Streptomyces rhizoryzae]
MLMGSSATPWPRYVSFLPAAMLAGGTLWNLVSPREYWGDYLLVAAVTAAGALLPLWHTIAIGVAIILVETGLLYAGGYLGNVSATAIELANLAFTTLIAIGVNRVVARHGRRLERVRSVAEAAQRAVVPQPPARVGPLAVAAVYKAAQIEALIGGDAYAVQDTPYGTRLLIADVRGKGMGAVGVVAVLLGTFRVEADQAPDLAALAGKLERALLKEAALREEEARMEGFVTALLGEIPPDGERVRLMNCGHPSPYLLHGTAVSVLDPDEPGLPLGMSGLGAPQAEPESRALPPGSTLLLVTDGVTEARDRTGAFYEPAGRLAGRGPFRGPDQVIDALVRDVERWTGGPRDDDMAVLALTRTGPGR